MIVETVEGCWVWLDSIPAGGRVTWSGDCGDGEHFAGGYGRLDVLDRAGVVTERYDGPIRNGLKYGRGTEYRTGATFYGEFRLGRRAGEGDEFFRDGFYSGGFRNGKRSGNGMMGWPGGDRYIGGWRDGLPHGYGEVLIGAEWIAGQWHAGCLLESGRTVAVAVPLDACRDLVPVRTQVAPGDIRMRDPEGSPPRESFNIVPCSDFIDGVRYC